MTGLHKRFKDYSDLTALLRSRGMIVDDARAIPVLRREGYYMIINGYKDLFLDSAATQQSGGDRFLPGTLFEDVYALFRFDRGLRSTLMDGIIRAEAALKSLCAHEFTRAYPNEVNPYLNTGHYDSAHRKSAGTLINKVFKRILELDDNPHNYGEYGGKAYIRHYMNDLDGQVPLWVLANDLSFGQIVWFYQTQTAAVRLAVATAFTGMGGARRSRRLTARTLDSMFNRLVFFRNLCAHDERCYNAHFDNRMNESVAHAFQDLAYLLDPDDYWLIRKRLDDLVSGLHRDLPLHAQEALRQVGYGTGSL
ncbi:Abi family protein [Bifidobacterium thermophilum]|uniref:Abi family protein n=1 Tax=Bifidobacterium thermophilum TaxID=33905 RepID=UPI003F907018